MSSSGAAADAARADVRAIIVQKGHAVEIARRAMTRLEEAFAGGVLERTPRLARTLEDLKVAIDQESGQKLGGKSAEASRFILRAIDRALDEA